MCFKFRKGKCALGDACKFSHAMSAKDAAKAASRLSSTANAQMDETVKKARSAEAVEDEDGGANNTGDSSDYCKRKRAILFGYSGANYHGLQAHTVQNPEFDTIENSLHSALVKIGAISASNSDALGKVGWARCARTDKGVSAAGQVVSAKIIVKGQEINGEVSSQDMAMFISDLNNALPSDIRVFKVLRVNGAFDPQKNVTGRIYGYLFPASLLGSSPDAFARFNAGLARFVGSHRYHNFTDKLHASDPSCRRMIQKCSAQDPEEILPSLPNVIRVSITGQSFLLYQIRRMMGFVIDVVRRYSFCSCMAQKHPRELNN